MSNQLIDVMLDIDKEQHGMTLEQATNKLRQKRKYVRKAKKVVRRARRAKVQEPDQADIVYPGLTETLCANACGLDGCVISGKSYCGHPRKGGLQTPDLGNHQALQRLQQASKQLGMKAMEKKYA